MVNEAIKRTLELIISFMQGEDRPKIDEWLRNDERAITLIIQVMQIFWSNGWRSGYDITEYETEESKALAEEIYKLAMDYKESVKQ